MSHDKSPGATFFARASERLAAIAEEVGDMEERAIDFGDGIVVGLVRAEIEKAAAYVTADAAQAAATAVCVMLNDLAEDGVRDRRREKEGRT